MRLSFISPQTKHIFSTLTKIWLFYFVLSGIILVGANEFLKMETMSTDKRVEKYKYDQTIIENKTQALNSQYERSIYEATLINNRIDNNNIRKEKIQNLLDLIPDKITISFIELSDTTLTLKGITPSKDFYYFGLQDPLKANFSKTSVSFYALSNGWYRFLSISNTKESSVNKVMK